MTTPTGQRKWQQEIICAMSGWSDISLISVAKEYLSAALDDYAALAKELDYLRAWFTERTVPVFTHEGRLVAQLINEHSGKPLLVRAECQELEAAKGVLSLKQDEYVREVGTWKIIQRLEEERDQLKAEVERLTKYLGEPGEGNRYRLMLTENERLREDLALHTSNGVSKDNARLVEENTKLKAEVDHYVDKWGEERADLNLIALERDRLKSKVEELKREIERLTEDDTYD